MAEWLRVRTTHAENLVPSMHIRQLTTACDSSFKESDTSSDPHGFLHTLMKTHAKNIKSCIRISGDTFILGLYSR